MVDIDDNLSQAPQEMDKNENESSSNETPQQQIQEQQEQPNEVSQGKESSRRGSASSSRSKASYSKPPVPEPFPKEYLVDALEKKYICLKCNEILREPVQIKECGHRLCYHCYEDIRCGEGPQCCPEDQMELDKDSSPDIDKAFKREVESLKAKCNVHDKGCVWQGAIVEFQTHIADCEYGDMLCINDCGAVFQRRYETKHLDKDCAKKIIPCGYCDDRFLREDKKSHLADCPKLPVTCPNKCDKKLTFRRDELEKHMNEECNRTKINCDYEDVCCEHKASRDKMLKHYTKEITQHVKLLHDKLIKHDVMLNQVIQNVATHGVKFDEHDERIGDLEKIANTQLIWRIDEYKDKKKRAENGDPMTLFSPGFITSKHGYRLSASVCLDGDGKGKGSHMSVFICILKGPYDALLKWPFDSRVSFTLLDQTTDSSQRKHINSSIKPNPSPENAQFLGRPYKIEKNASFGAAKFAKHEEVESRNYVKDDTLFLKINVDTEGNSEPIV